MTRRLRRFFLHALIAAGILGSILVPTTPLATAGDYDSIVADHQEAELCGWGTHDSGPIQVAEKSQTNIAHKAAPTRTSSTFDSSLATVAAAACASAGVSVEQFVEPFAMVGPQLSKSLQSVKLFQRWLETTAEQQATAAEADPAVKEVVDKNDSEPFAVSHVPIVDFDGEIPATGPWAESLASAAEINLEIDPIVQLKSQLRDDLSLLINVDDEAMRQQLDELAAEEPIDAVDAHTAAYGPSILATLSDSEKQQPIDSDQLVVESTSDIDESIRAVAVGASPMIFTISEAYLPYDLAVRDLYAGGVLSRAKRPFCIRARMDLPEFDSAFDNNGAVAIKRDEIESQPVVPYDHDFVSSGSADCLLDDWVWKATLALEEGGSVRKRLQPRLAGRQVAALVVKHNRVAEGIANRLASAWPQTPRPLPTAGALLLARAEAVEAGDEEQNAGAPVVDDAEQLAQATATLKNWLRTVEGAVTTIKSRWLPRLAQVSPDPNDSGSTSRR